MHCVCFVDIIKAQRTTNKQGTKDDDLQDAQDDQRDDCQAVSQEGCESQRRIQEGSGRRLQGDRKPQKVFLKKEKRLLTTT